MRALLSLAAAGALLFSTSGAQAAPPAEREPAGYVVVLRDGAPDPGTVAARHGVATRHAYGRALKGFAANVPSGKLAALAADPAVEMVAEDRWLDFDAQTTPTGVARIEAVRKSGEAGAAVDADVAVIDTGVDPTHPDLNVVGGYNCTSKKTDAWADDAGHGTLMAGVVGARDNATGVVGVAPGARIWAVKVGGPKGAKTSDVICGLDWVAGQGKIKIASLSLSGPGADDGNCGRTKKDALHRAICRTTAAGVLTVVAAGNAGTDVAGVVPAAYSEVLAVTAMADYDGKSGGGAAATCLAGTDDSAASFSNHATPGSAPAGHVIAAPGVCIASTAMGGGYQVVSGTSPATPHVAGTAARCLASGACRGLTPAQLAAKLRGDAAARPSSYGFVGDPGHPLAGRYYGWLVYAGAY